MSGICGVIQPLYHRRIIGRLSGTGRRSWSYLSQVRNTVKDVLDIFLLLLSEDIDTSAASGLHRFLHKSVLYG
jgi:hypothetical protein